MIFSNIKIGHNFEDKGRVFVKNTKDTALYDKKEYSFNQDDKVNDFVDHLHPLTVKELTRPDGSIRIPSYEEWAEDYGLGYMDRLHWLGE